MTDGPTCLNCGTGLTHTLVDLGEQPLSNSYLPLDFDVANEPKYPLHARVCHDCLLVQVDDVVPADRIFNENYAYFSSFSESWLAHCRQYVATMTARFRLDDASLVGEIASNDGYMLQYFVERGVPVYGIEPTANTAAVAESRGVPTEIAFFGFETAERLASAGRQVDLLAAKNVLAHVPDINDFVSGIPVLLKDEGVFTVEFPHLLNLINLVQFDTIYHEHFTYLSLLAIERIFERHGLVIFDVQTVPTHGGSLRVFAAKAGSSHAVCTTVANVRAEEVAAGLDRMEGYADFEPRVRKVRDDLNRFLDDAKADGRAVAAYGAAAKGNTLLNYCGITSAQIDYVVDRNPAKQTTLLPGSHIPVSAPERLRLSPPDYLLILPWNLKDEIVAQNADLAERGMRFVTCIPELVVE